VARHLHRHAIFYVALGSFKGEQGRKFVLGVKALDSLGRLVLEKRFQAVDDLAVVFRILDRIPESLFPFLLPIRINVTH
jgi:hypothetical protein